MDVNRKTVDYLVLHHAVTPTWESKSREELINWFSANGFSRAYGNNPANWSGLYKPNGERSYSQAQLAGQRVDSTTPDATMEERKAGFRLVELVKDIYGQICWHAGNWDINTRSIGIEILGDYRYIDLRENDCKVIADFWRPQDQKLNGTTAIVGHNEVSIEPTSCPVNIMKSRQRIVDLVNSSDSGWPVEPVITPPVIPPIIEPEPKDECEPIPEPTEEILPSTPEVEKTIWHIIGEYIIEIIKRIFKL